MFQAVINSTITPNMTFTKTSQKFGQWTDTRANTVYGLGFTSEQDLAKVKCDNTLPQTPTHVGDAKHDILALAARILYCVFRETPYRNIKSYM